MTSLATTHEIAAHEEETLAQGHFGENYKDRSDSRDRGRDYRRRSPDRYRRRSPDRHVRGGDRGRTRRREETTTVFTDRLFAKGHRIEMQSVS